MESELLQLRSSTDFKETFDFLPVPVLVAHREGEEMKHLYLNQLFVQQLGYTINDIPNLESWYKHAYPDVAYRDEVAKTWKLNTAKALHTGKNAIEYKARIFCGDQSYRWFSVKASIWEKDLHIVAFTDIDSVKQKEVELQRLNTLKDKLFSVISHDVRSPLASLRGLLDLLETGTLPEAAAENLLAQVSKQLYGVSDMLDSLLLWASNQLKEEPPQPQLFLLDELTGSVVDLVRLDAQRKRIKIAQDLKAIPVWADREMIRLVIRNLLTNALKFSQAGSEIKISTVYTQEFAVISVKDSGVGMDEVLLQKLFSYEILSRPGTSGERGTGLGLVFCREAITANGGKIRAESQPGAGSTFYFTIPLAEPFV
jgi:signal transduction histidine kinase